MNVRKNVDGLKFSTWLLLAGALVLFIYSSYMWRKNIYLSDERVVWGAIEKALSTNGVEVFIDDSTETTTQRETTKLNFKDELLAESRNELKNEELDSIVKVLSTRDKDYLYYERNNSTNNPGLKILEGQWVDVSQPDQTESKQLADTLTNGALVFVGNLGAKDKKELVAQMKSEKLYKIIGVAKIEKTDGREVRTYKVKLDPAAYNRALAKYLSAIGLTQAASEVQLENLDDETNPVIELAIEPGTRLLVASGYPDLTSTGVRFYSKWGEIFSLQIPSAYISTEELQSKVDTINSQSEQQ